MKETTLPREEIIKMIENGRWDDLYESIVDNKINKPNELIINGNNILHIAAIRGQTKFVERLFELCYSKDPNTSEESSDPLRELAKIECGINPDMPNRDGLPAIHLYYKYGGTSKKLLKLSSVCYLDKHYTSLLTYLIGSIDLLEVYVNSTIQKSCLQNVDLVGSDVQPHQNIYYLLIKQIKRVEDSKLKARYMKIVSHLMRNLTNKKAVHYAIAMDSMEVFDHLISEDLFDPMVRSTNNETPLINATTTKKEDFVSRILEEYHKLSQDPSYSELPTIKEYISLYRQFAENRPINICIRDRTYDILGIMIRYLKDYRKETGDESIHIETDEYNSTYLHTYLMREEPRELDPIDKKIISYLIKYTDLNQENYHGYTPGQLIFLKEFWKLDHIKECLKGRKIDLLKTDPDGHNIYSYVTKKDNAEFMRLTSELVMVTNTSGSSDETKSDLFDAEKIIDVVHRDTLKNKKGYGLFNPTQMNYVLFMLYLQQTHSNLFIPSRPYDVDKKNDDLYMMEMTSYPLSIIQDTMNDIQLSDHSRFYSYSPHMVTWHNAHLFLINPNLSAILKDQHEIDTELKRRFIMIKLLVVINENANHANCLIYDRKKREAWRFESYGLTDMVKDGEKLDMELENLLESVYGKIKYYGPSAYLANIKFQLADNEDFAIAKNLGDPGGYCLAWCVWFVDVICSNLKGDDDEPTVNYLMRNYITRERFGDILFERGKKRTPSARRLSSSVNIYLEYIRQYGHHLDAEKNLILKKMGVSSDAYYRFMVKSTEVAKIDRHLQLDRIKYD